MSSGPERTVKDKLFQRAGSAEINPYFWNAAIEPELKCKQKEATRPVAPR
jgi:hypothetical protein